MFLSWVGRPAVCVGGTVADYGLVGRHSSHRAAPGSSIDFAVPSTSGLALVFGWGIVLVHCCRWLEGGRSRGSCVDSDRRRFILRRLFVQRHAVGRCRSMVRTSRIGSGGLAGPPRRDSLCGRYVCWVTDSKNKPRMDFISLFVARVCRMCYRIVPITQHSLTGRRRARVKQTLCIQ